MWLRVSGYHHLQHYSSSSKSCATTKNISIGVYSFGEFTMDYTRVVLAQDLEERASAYPRSIKSQEIGYRMCTFRT